MTNLQELKLRAFQNEEVRSEYDKIKGVKMSKFQQMNDDFEQGVIHTAITLELDFNKYVGKLLEAKQSGYGFYDEEVGNMYKVFGYSDTGYGLGKGFKIDYGDGDFSYVGVESFGFKGDINE